MDWKMQYRDYKGPRRDELRFRVVTLSGAGRKNGVWLVPTNHPSPGDEVYYDPQTGTSEGFGGSTLSFPLEDGSAHRAQGPWHGNSDDLYRDTGLDLREQHSLRCVIGLAWDHKAQPWTIQDVIHQDSDWMVGNFDRHIQLAKELALPDGRYAYFKQSLSGAQSGYMTVENGVAR